jgi:SHS family lactate transporter-like MFS transporter
MNAVDQQASTGMGAGLASWRLAAAASILGWVLDAFDFFVVVFLLPELATKFHVGKSAIVWSLTVTLAMRPVGALFFGAIADKFGRRRPLIACVVYFSCVTVASGLVPTYSLFLLCRLLYGIGLGGYWGIGASYAMETAPPRSRGLLSGMMQGGYPFGYLLASVGMQTIAPAFGWRAMFFVGSLLAVTIVVLILLAPESAAWKSQGEASFQRLFGVLYKNAGMFLYLLLVMMGMSCLSHGTQDLYPDFLRTLPWMSHATILGMKAAFGIPVVYNLGAILGALLIGNLSERVGRRRAVMGALTLSLLSIPAWAFGSTALVLVFGAFLMQAGAQGAFGVMPAHLNELSPAIVRSLFPGVVYQLGVLIASPTPPLQGALQRHFGYPIALSSFEVCVIVSLLLIFALGPERRGIDFSAV